MDQASATRVTLAIGVTQTLAWASSQYLPAVLAAPMAHELGVPVTTVFAAFSGALVISALLGPIAGRWIDRYGGRWVLSATSVIFALGLTMLGLAQGVVGCWLAWLVLGVGMGAGLYDAAFATLVALYGTQARRAMTGITLIAGFASTVGWPLSSYLDAQFGWRVACLVWAGLHLTLGLLLNLRLPRRQTGQAASESPQTQAVAQQAPAPTARVSPWASAALATIFAATWFVTTAMAAHLPMLLQVGGVSYASAIAISALIGPAQVVARLMEFTFLRKLHPVLSTRIASLLHPLGALVFGVVGAPGATAFGVLHGAGNGILTIAKGTLPLVVFGPEGYGQRQGMIMVPARVAQALAPWLFGVCMAAFGLGALWVSAGVSLLATVLLLMLPGGPGAPASRPAAPPQLGE